MQPSRMLLAGILPLFLLLVVTAEPQVLTASNTVATSALSRTAGVPTVRQFAPAECKANMSEASLNALTRRLMPGQNGNNSANLILGTSANDTITASGGDDCVVGGGGADNIQGGNNADVILGGLGNDTVLRGNGGNDFVFGGDGNDSGIRGDAGTDTCDGGPGTDSVADGTCETVISIP
ncbi:MAG: hypothetical protein AMXMBFR23_04040 [Chloroflexota bacterium]